MTTTRRCIEGFVRVFQKARRGFADWCAAFNATKAVAMTIVACFLLSFVTGQSIAGLLENHREAQSLQKSVESFAIPPSLGRISEAKYFGSEEVVINIQDLHCHPEVQRNISKILSLLDDKYRMPAVYLEGAWENVNTAWLSGIKDTALKQRLTESLLAKGRLTGAEYFSAVTGKTDIIRGLEDKGLYLANLKRLNTILDSQENIEALLNHLDTRITSLKREYFNANQKKFDSLMVKYAGGSIDARKYYALLKKHADKLGVDVAAYPNFNGYVGLMDSERELDYRNISRELQNFVKTLRQTLPYSAYTALVKETDNFSNTDRLNTMLIAIACDYHLNVPRNYPALARFFSYIETSRSVNPLGLVREEGVLIRELRDRLPVNRSQREVAFLDSFRKYFSSYETNKISADEYTYFLENLPRFKQLLAKYTDSALMPLFDPYAKVLSDYYAANVTRNDCFLKNIACASGFCQTEFINPMADQTRQALDSIKSGKNLKVVITGGFHTEGLSQLLTDKKITHIIITPNVTQDTAASEQVYTKAIREQAVFLGQAFANPPATISITQEIINIVLTAVEEPGMSREKVIVTVNNILEENTNIRLTNIDTATRESEFEQDKKDGKPIVWHVDKDGNWTENTGKAPQTRKMSVNNRLGAAVTTGIITGAVGAAITFLLGVSVVGVGIGVIPAAFFLMQRSYIYRAQNAVPLVRNLAEFVANEQLNPGITKKADGTFWFEGIQVVEMQVQPSGDVVAARYNVTINAIEVNVGILVALGEGIIIPTWAVVFPAQSERFQKALPPVIMEHEVRHARSSKSRIAAFLRQFDYRFYLEEFVVSVGDLFYAPRAMSRTLYIHRMPSPHSGMTLKRAALLVLALTLFTGHTQAAAGTLLAVNPFLNAVMLSLVLFISVLITTPIGRKEAAPLGPKDLAREINESYDSIPTEVTESLVAAGGDIKKINIILDEYNNRSAESVIEIGLRLMKTLLGLASKFFVRPCIVVISEPESQKIVREYKKQAEDMFMQGKVSFALMFGGSATRLGLGAMYWVNPYVLANAILGNKTGLSSDQQAKILAVYNKTIEERVKVRSDKEGREKENFIRAEEIKKYRDELEEYISGIEFNLKNAGISDKDKDSYVKQGMGPLQLIALRHKTEQICRERGVGPAETLSKVPVLIHVGDEDFDEISRDIAVHDGYGFGNIMLIVEPKQHMRKLVNGKFENDEILPKLAYSHGIAQKVWLYSGMTNKLVNGEWKEITGTTVYDDLLAKNVEVRIDNRINDPENINPGDVFDINRLALAYGYHAQGRGDLFFEMFPNPNKTKGGKPIEILGENFMYEALQAKADSKLKDLMTQADDEGWEYNRFRIINMNPEGTRDMLASPENPLRTSIEARDSSKVSGLKPGEVRYDLQLVTSDLSYSPNRLKVVFFKKSQHEENRDFKDIPSLRNAMKSMVDATAIFNTSHIVSHALYDIRKAIKFGTSGWRDKISGDFNEENIHRATEGYIRYLDEEKSAGRLKGDIIYLVGDARKFNMRNVQNTAAQLAAAGFEPIIIDLESTPTPAVTFLAQNDPLCAGVINFTASHNPDDDNGMKISDGKGGPLDTAATDRISKYANAAVTYKTCDFETALKTGSIKRVDVDELVNDYRDYVISQLKDQGLWDSMINAFVEDKELMFVIDCMQGTSVKYYKAIMYAMAKELEAKKCKRDFYEIINGDNTDPQFSMVNGAPNPTLEQHNSALRQKLVDLQVQGKRVIGLSADGDSDRFGFFDIIEPNSNTDPKETFISSNDGIPISAAYRLEKAIASGQKEFLVVRTSATSMFIDAIVEYYSEKYPDIDIKIEETAVGFKYAVPLMRKAEAEGRMVLIAGESSAHVGFNTRSLDDGMLISLSLAGIVASEGSLIEYKKKLEKLVGKKFLNKEDATDPDRDGSLKIKFNALVDTAKIECDKDCRITDKRSNTWKRVEEVIQNSTHYKPDDIASIDTLDGIRIIFKNNSNFIIRYSGTEAKGRIYTQSVLSDKATSEQQNAVNDELSSFAYELLGLASPSVQVESDNDEVGGPEQQPNKPMLSSIFNIAASILVGLLGLSALATPARAMTFVQSVSPANFDHSILLVVLALTVLTAITALTIRLLVEHFVLPLLSIRKAPDSATSGRDTNAHKNDLLAKQSNKYIQTLKDSRFAERLRDAFLKTKEEVERNDPLMSRIGFDGESNRLGWIPENLKWILDDREKNKDKSAISQTVADAIAIKNAGFKFVIVCGMGGSGLSIQLVNETFGESGTRVYSLRTTSPDGIENILEDIQKQSGLSLEEALKQTLIIPISKSGTTEETAQHFKYFMKLYADVFGDKLTFAEMKKHFWVMTDNGSPFDTGDYEQRDIQLNGRGDIGGRFTSPTTRIFLLPLALSLPVETAEVTIVSMLERAYEANNIEKHGYENDLYLNFGAWKYQMARDLHKDKLTMLVSKEMSYLPNWTEQLEEESLGKDGKGITLFYGEDLDLKSLKPANQSDRSFLIVRLKSDTEQARKAKQLKKLGYPMFEIVIDSKEDMTGVMLGLQRSVAAFAFLWGYCFTDQPAVTAYKDATNAIKNQLKPGEKVEVPGDWEYASFEGMKIYYTPLIQADAMTKEDLATEVRRLSGKELKDADGAVVYAAIINICRKNGKFEAAETALYGTMTLDMKKIMQSGRTGLFTRTLDIPSKLGEGPDKNHSYHQNIQDGKDMWLSTYFLPLSFNQPPGGFDDNLIKAQCIGTTQSVADGKRKAVLITMDGTVQASEAAVDSFYRTVEDIVNKTNSDLSVRDNGSSVGLMRTIALVPMAFLVLPAIGVEFQAVVILMSGLIALGAAITGVVLVHNSTIMKPLNVLRRVGTDYAPTPEEFKWALNRIGTIWFLFKSGDIMDVLNIIKVALQDQTYGGDDIRRAAEQTISRLKGNNDGKYFSELEVIENMIGTYDVKYLLNKLRNLDDSNMRAVVPSARVAQGIAEVRKKVNLDRFADNLQVLKKSNEQGEVIAALEELKDMTGEPYNTRLLKTALWNYERAHPQGISSDVADRIASIREKIKVLEIEPENYNASISMQGIVAMSGFAAGALGCWVSGIGPVYGSVIAVLAAGLAVVGYLGYGAVAPYVSEKYYRKILVPGSSKSQDLGVDQRMALEQLRSSFISQDRKADIILDCLFAKENANVIDVLVENSLWFFEGTGLNNAIDLGNTELSPKNFILQIISTNTTQPEVAREKLASIIQGSRTPSKESLTGRMVPDEAVSSVPGLIVMTALAAVMIAAVFAAPGVLTLGVAGLCAAVIVIIAAAYLRYTSPGRNTANSSSGFDKKLKEIFLRSIPSTMGSTLKPSESKLLGFKKPLILMVGAALVMVALTHAVPLSPDMALLANMLIGATFVGGSWSLSNQQKAAIAVLDYNFSLGKSIDNLLDYSDKEFNSKSKKNLLSELAKLNNPSKFDPKAVADAFNMEKYKDANWAALIVIAGKIYGKNSVDLAEEIIKFTLNVSEGDTGQMFKVAQAVMQTDKSKIQNNTLEQMKGKLPHDAYKKLEAMQSTPNNENAIGTVPGLIVMTALAAVMIAAVFAAPGVLTLGVAGLCAAVLAIIAAAYLRYTSPAENMPVIKQSILTVITALLLAVKSIVNAAPRLTSNATEIDRVLRGKSVVYIGDRPDFVGLAVYSAKGMRPTAIIPYDGSGENYFICNLSVPTVNGEQRKVAMYARSRADGVGVIILRDTGYTIKDKKIATAMDSNVLFAAAAHEALVEVHENIPLQKTLRSHGISLVKADILDLGTSGLLSNPQLYNDGNDATPSVFIGALILDAPDGGNRELTVKKDLLNGMVFNPELIPEDTEGNIPLSAFEELTDNAKYTRKGPGSVSRYDNSAAGVAAHRAETLFFEGLKDKAAMGVIGNIKGSAMNIPVSAIRVENKNSSLGVLTDLKAFFLEKIKPCGLAGINLSGFIIDASCKRAGDTNIVDFGQYKQGSVEDSVAADQAAKVTFVAAEKELKELSKNDTKALNAYKEAQKEWLDNYAMEKAKSDKHIAEVYKFMQWKLTVQLKNSIKAVQTAGGSVYLPIEIDRENISEACKAIEYWLSFGFNAVHIETKEALLPEDVTLLAAAVNTARDARAYLTLPEGTGEGIKALFKENGFVVDVVELGIQGNTEKERSILDKVRDAFRKASFVFCDAELLWGKRVEWFVRAKDGRLFYSRMPLDSELLGFNYMRRFCNSISNVVPKLTPEESYDVGYRKGAGFKAVVSPATLREIVSKEMTLKEAMVVVQGNKELYRMVYLIQASGKNENAERELAGFLRRVAEEQLYAEYTRLTLSVPVTETGKKSLRAMLLAAASAGITMQDLKDKRVPSVAYSADGNSLITAARAIEATNVTLEKVRLAINPVVNGIIRNGVADPSLAGEKSDTLKRAIAEIIYALDIVDERRNISPVEEIWNRINDVQTTQAMLQAA